MRLKMPFATISGNQPAQASGRIENSSASMKKAGILDGRIVAPCKATRCLTDMQIRKIKIVALAIVLVLGPILAGVLTGGLGAIICGVSFGIVGVALGALFMRQWPRADFQTSEGAEKILNDLRTESLQDLHRNYNFSELAHYGYVSGEDANKMQSLYNRMPIYETIYDGDRINHYATGLVNQANKVYERREKIEAEFNELRRLPGFGAWK